MQEVSQRIISFLAALFNKTADVVEKIYTEFDVQSHEDIARLFRLRMTDGQSAQHCNEYRIKFYEDVIRLATAVSRLLSCTCYLPFLITAGYICQRRGIQWARVPQRTSQEGLPALEEHSY